MSKSKNPEQNPIENAIGNRAKTTKDVPKIVDTEAFKNHAMVQTPSPCQADDPTPPQSIQLNETPETPSPSEMRTLEELNHSAEERFGDKWPEEKTLNPPIQENRTKVELQQTGQIPVSKPDLPPVTENSTRESPPQKVGRVVDVEALAKHINDPSNNKCLDCRVCVHPKTNPTEEDNFPEVNTTLQINCKHCTPAEDRELTALKYYILDDGFVLATVAFHIVSLCAEPLTTPSTTNWDFVDRAKIPDMVLALLNQPGYLDGIWPSLKIIMGSNKGNPAWTAGIATTIAFFDTIRVLPTLKELKQ